MDWFKSWFNFNTDLTLANVDKLLKLINPIYAAGSTGISKLKESARDWYQSFVELQKIPDSDLSRELLVEKRNLLTRGHSIVGKVRALGIGADAFNGSQLGAAFLIPVAVIGTAAGLMLYWTYDFIKFKDKLTVYRAAIQSGESATSAINIMNQLEPAGLFSSLGNYAKYAIYIGGGYTAYKIAKSQKWI